MSDTPDPSADELAEIRRDRVEELGGEPTSPNATPPEDPHVAQVWSRANRELVRRVGLSAGHDLAEVSAVAHVSFGPGDGTRYDVALVDLNHAALSLGSIRDDYPERGLLVACVNLDRLGFVVDWPTAPPPHWAYVAGKLRPGSDWTAVILAELIDAAREGAQS